MRRNEPEGRIPGPSPMVLVLIGMSLATLLKEDIAATLPRQPPPASPARLLPGWAL